MSKENKLTAANAKIADLERALSNARASLASACANAFDKMEEASVENFMGAGVVLCIRDPNGRDIIEPVMIRDGLSSSSIAALKDDLCRSFELATLASPAMARNHVADKARG